MIDYSAFADCCSLENIELPKKLITLNYYAFENCTSLQSVVIPDSIRTIEWGAFQRCSQLQTLDLPETLEKNWNIQWLYILVGHSCFGKQSVLRIS